MALLRDDERSLSPGFKISEIRLANTFSQLEWDSTSVPQKNFYYSKQAPNGVILHHLQPAGQNFHSQVVMDKETELPSTKSIGSDAVDVTDILSKPDAKVNKNLLLQLGAQLNVGILSMMSFCPCGKFFIIYLSLCPSTSSWDAAFFYPGIVDNYQEWQSDFIT